MTLRIQGALRKKVVPARRHGDMTTEWKAEMGLKGGPAQDQEKETAGVRVTLRPRLWKDKGQKPRI